MANNTTHEVGIEVLNFEEPDVHSVTAARLLLQENYSDMHANEGGVDWLLRVSPKHGWQYYGLIERGVVIGAINATHRNERWGDDIPGYHSTFFNLWAVHPERDHDGHAQRLLRHVAEQAIEHGDSELLAGTGGQSDPRGMYLRSLGFLPHRHIEVTGHRASTWLDIDADELVAKTQ